MDLFDELTPASRETKIEHCASAVYDWYVKYRRLPSPDEIFREYGQYFVDKREVESIFEETAFEKKVCRRGVPWKRYSALSARQLLVIEAVMNPMHKGTLSKRLKDAGTNWGEWRAWNKNPQFKERVDRYAKDVLENSIPQLERALVNIAEGGDLNAIKYTFELTGRYNPAQQNAMEVKAVLAAVIEIITNHVRDRDVLSKIGTDLTALGMRALPSGSIGDFNGNSYVPSEVIETRTD